MQLYSSSGSAFDNCPTNDDIPECCGVGSRQISHRIVYFRGRRVALVNRVADYAFPGYRPLSSFPAEPLTGGPATVALSLSDNIDDE